MNRSSPKIVFFNRFFFPDSSATSQMVSDLAFELAAKGYEVHAVASLSQPGLPAYERVRGVTIYRVGRATKANSLLLKAADYVRYYSGARALAKKILDPGDVAVAKTDPPLLGVAIGPIAKRNGASLVTWLQDVFPEVAIEYGVPGARIALIRRLRNRWLRNSEHCIVISDAMKSRIIEEAALPPDKVRVIPNWAYGTQIIPRDAATSTLRKEWGLSEKFVLMYSGNLGRVHEFGTLLRAAEILKPHEGIVFVVVGSGKQLDSVRALVRERGLSNVQFRPMQMRDSLSESLGSADLHLCVLRPEFEGLVVPSKIYGIMAAGRPCIFIGDVNGEPARLFEENDAGRAIATGDSRGLADAILELRADAERRARMGHESRRLFEQRFDFPIAAGKWYALLEELRLKHKPAA